ncbi:hypothetical protein FW774_03675 (plasmid) [Pedobacter sp. BS3]|uniref:hypothetical protein n=1 Tax=Pedobacter sp. BS3 TaxID=2567937 RepID=UPI0011EF9138|nr:hypothetical protein [Pedobacter sp. BS3]TZF86159.1 hypothetical protein FW774_03675 [Pedobacter sp. BS3]
MKEAIIKYRNPKTLKALYDLSKYLGFSVSSQNPVGKKQGSNTVNGVPVIPGDKTIDIAELTAIFTGKELNASDLRKTEWRRNK